VKTLITEILQGAGKTYATPGNRNNEIGMPLAVIETPDDAAFAVYEMGTGKPGDIAYLTAIAPPDVALVNNVAPAHLERMGSLLEIANTKAAVYDDLRSGGAAAINADDAFAPYFAERAHGHRLIRFGLDADADVTARDIALDAEEYRLLAMVDGKRSLYELATKGPLAPPENARLLYAYSVLQLIRKVGVAEPAAAPGVIKIKLRSES